MKKRLFLTLMVLVIGYALYDFQASEKALKNKDVQLLIVPLKPKQIQNIVIEKASEPTIEFNRDEKGWMMVKPQIDAASEARLEAFIDGITTEKALESVPYSENLGMNPPLGVISLTNNLGEKTKIEIGTVKNFEGNAFLRKNGGNQILIGSSTWFSKLSQPTSEYRDLRFMRFSANATDKLVFSDIKNELVLENQEAQWIFPKQKKTRVDQNRVREIISMLNTSEAIEIVSETQVSEKDLEAWNLHKPVRKITVYRGDQKPWSIAFAKTDKVHRVLTSEPQWVLKISPTDFAKFAVEPTVDYFRDRAEPFNFEKSKVNKVSVIVNGKEISPKSDSEAYRTIVSRLATMKLADFEPKIPTGYAFSDQVGLSDESGKELIRLSWGKPLPAKTDEQTRVIAKSSLFPTAFTVYEGDIDTMKIDQALQEKK